RNALNRPASSAARGDRHGADARRGPRAPERNPGASLLGRILVAETHVPPPAPGSPGIFALSDSTRIHRLVTGAGFTPPEVAEIGIAWRFPSPDAYWWFLTEMAGALSPALAVWHRRIRPGSPLASRPDGRSRRVAP